VSLSSVCLFVTFVRPTKPVKIFDNIFTHFVRHPSAGADLCANFYGDCHRGTLPSGVKRKMGSQI